MDHFSNRAPSPVLRTPEVVVERRARVEAEEELEALRTKVKSMERHAAAISRATQHTKRQVKAIQAAKSQKATDMMRRERFRMQKQNMVRQRHQQLVLYRAESQQQRAARKRRAREEKRANAEAVKAMERDALASTNLNRTQWQREARSKGTAVRARLKSAHDTRISDLSAAQKKIEVTPFPCSEAEMRPRNGCVASRRPGQRTLQNVTRPLPSAAARIGQGSRNLTE